MTTPDPTERATDALHREIAGLDNLVNVKLDAAEGLTAERFRSIDAQLDSLRSNFETSIGSVGSSVADLKERVTGLESSKQGHADQRTESRQASAGVVALIGVGVAVLLAILAVMTFLTANAM